MTSKLGRLLKNEKTREAVYAVLQDIFLAHHAKCFEVFRSHFISRGNLGDMETEFETFMGTARKIFNNAGGEFCIEKMEQAIPGNKWMAFYETHIAGLVSELTIDPRFVRYNKDYEKIIADVFKKANELCFAQPEPERRAEYHGIYCRSSQSEQLV
jgi:hypothetical protein